MFDNINTHARFKFTLRMLRWPETPPTISNGIQSRSISLHQVRPHNGSNASWKFDFQMSDKLTITFSLNTLLTIGKFVRILMTNALAPLCMTKVHDQQKQKARNVTDVQRSQTSLVCKHVPARRNAIPEMLSLWFLMLLPSKHCAWWKHIRSTESPKAMPCQLTVDVFPARRNSIHYVEYGETNRRNQKTTKKPKTAGRSWAIPLREQ